LQFIKRTCGPFVNGISAKQEAISHNEKTWLFESRKLHSTKLQQNLLNTVRDTWENQFKTSHKVGFAIGQYG
jgi:uncharacterized protein (DUF2461 family)